MLEQELTLIMSFLQTGSIMAPIFFILFHVLRQFLFIPVVVVCMSGGILFGALAGTLYSVIGLTLSCIAFYGAVHQFPRFMARILQMKNKCFGNRQLNSQQVAVLRLIPFIHYHLLSLCLMETKKGLKDYAHASLLTNIPLAFIYTIFGNYIRAFSPTLIILLLLSLTLLLYLVREKQTVIPWKEFFSQNSVG